MELRVAPVVELLTVSAPILDATATGTATTFSSDELAKIPTARDPFSLVRSVPGVLLDRVNVGGNETGQAPTVVSKGTRPQDTLDDGDHRRIRRLFLQFRRNGFLQHGTGRQLAVTDVRQELLETLAVEHRLVRLSAVLEELLKELRKRGDTA